MGGWVEPCVECVMPDFDQPNRFERQKRKLFWLWRRWQQLLFRLSPKYLMPRDYRRDLVIDRADDEAENARYRIPPDQTYDVLGLMLVEYYGPSDFDGLASNLKRLGWLRSHSGEESVAEWLRSRRLVMRGQSSTTLARIVRSSDSAHSLLPSNPVNRLPPWCKNVDIHFLQINPAMTAAVTFFQLEPDHVCDVISAARQSFSTEMRPMKTPGVSIHGPELLKREAVSRTRQNVAADAREWHASHIPGIFAQGGTGISNPVMELARTDGLDAFPAPRRSGPQGPALELLGLHNFWSAWEDESPTKVIFNEQLHDRSLDISPYSVLVYAKDAEAQLLGKMYHDPGHTLYRHHQHFFTIIGLGALLRHYGRILSTARDRMPSVTRARTVAKSAESYREQHASIGDIAIIVAELKRDDFRARIRKLSPRYIRRDKLGGAADDQFSDVLSQHIDNTIERLETLHDVVRNTITDRLAVSTSVEMLKLSRRTLFIAALALAVSLVGVFADSWVPLLKRAPPDQMHSGAEFETAK